MQTAGARALREDDNGMSREAVLLQWERKIEVAERLDSGRFARSSEEGAAVDPVPLRPAAGPADEASEPKAEAREGHRFERRPVRITGEPTPARRRAPVLEAQIAQPDRIALWAFLLGLVLVAVAAGTAHA
jgi:hypothetical protein